MVLWFSVFHFILTRPKNRKKKTNPTSLALISCQTPSFFVLLCAKMFEQVVSSHHPHFFFAHSYTHSNLAFVSASPTPNQNKTLLSKSVMTFTLLNPMVSSLSSIFETTVHHSLFFSSLFSSLFQFASFLASRILNYSGFQLPHWSLLLLLSNLLIWES